jgi:proline dehydrogenase
MQQYGVKSILDYSVEKDVAPIVEGEKLDATNASKEKQEKKSPDTPLLRKYTGYAELWDRRSGVASARTFFYAGEPECDDNARIFIESVDAAAEVGKNIILF